MADKKTIIGDKMVYARLKERSNWLNIFIQDWIIIKICFK